MNSPFSLNSLKNKLFKINQDNIKEFEEASSLNIQPDNIETLFQSTFLKLFNSNHKLICINSQLQQQLSFFSPLIPNNQKNNLTELFSYPNQNSISKYITFLILNNPITDLNTILSRNQIINHFISSQNNNTLFYLFSKLKTIENDILWILQNGTILNNQPTNKEPNIINSTLFYSTPFLQILNKNYHFQTAYYFYNLYFYPIYQFIQPFFVFIISYFVMNQLGKRFGIQLPFSFFIKIAKQQIYNFFNFKSDSPTWYGKTFFIFTKILYILLTLYSIAQMVFQRIFINKITNFIHLKLQTISTLIKLTEEINQLNLPYKLEFNKINLNTNFYLKEPSYFINKGHITTDYFKIINDQNLNEYIRDTWIKLSYLNSLYGVSNFLNKCHLKNLNFQLLNPNNFNSNIKTMKIVEGFHPLLLTEENISEKIICNNYDSNKGVNIITGPNASGKSVYLKMIGLNCLLSHTLGIVFGKETEMPIINRIMIHMGNRDVVGQKSLFEAEVINANEILKGINENEKGLYIFDELFSSTNPKEGEKTTINYIKQIAGCENQISIISTHYPVLKIKKMGIKCEFRKLGKNHKVLKGINKKKEGMNIYQKVIQNISKNNKTESNIEKDKNQNENFINSFN